jgi:hypothetical protein
MVTPTASIPALVTAGPEFGFDLGRPISAVGERIIAGVALVQQPIQLLTVCTAASVTAYCRIRLCLAFSVQRAFVGISLSALVVNV